jgi:hypothetical protein
MIREELKDLQTDPAALRKFGLTVGGVFVLIGGWFLFRHKPLGPFLLIPGALLVTFGLVLPKTLKHAYVGWMALAFSLGLIVSTLLLTLFFFVVVTPIGLATRLLGKDFLAQKLDLQAQSYWLSRDPSVVRQRSDYERQF